MKRKLLLLAFSFPLILCNPIFAQSKDVLSAIMSNQWVKNYKKLKSDLEDKAGYAKNLKNISADEKEVIKTSYVKTSEMLDKWLDHLVDSIDSNHQTLLVQLSEGTMNTHLKDELMKIFTFYSDDFSVRYEEITGIKSKSVVAHSKLVEDQKVLTPALEVSSVKLEKEYWIANLKLPLQLASWNSLF